MTMRNTPLIRFDSETSGCADRPSAALSDVPVVRLALLMVLLAVPVAVISARLFHVQGRLTDEFTAAWTQTTRHEEPIPCRDGRILSADGQVLAQDRLRFDLLVHYRWLEEPPDDQWLTQQALSRLDRHDRRRPERVDATKQEVLEARVRMWERLAATLDVPQHELTAARADIQRRVESIVDSVTRRRDERIARSTPAAQPHRSLWAGDVSPLSRQWWKQLHTTVVEQLTTAPRRRLDPVIVQEELDHHLVASDVELDAVTTIETAPSLFPGVLIRAASERIYPQEDAAGHIVGIRTQVQPDEVSPPHQAAGPTALHAGDRIGRSGIERSFDDVLRGRPGTRELLRDRRGEIVAQRVTQKPVHGQDVVLTIDLALQRTAEQLLDQAIAPYSAAGEPAAAGTGPQGGCLVVLDVRTGDVITAAAAPRVSLQLLADPDPHAWQAAVADVRRPFFPRVTRMTIPPGSVFKILTAIAVLESRRIDPDEPFFCQGYLDRPDRNRCYIYRHYGVGHGEMTLSDAICESCNVYFFHAARELGPGVIAEWAARFGLGAPTGAEVPGERAGHLPRTDRQGAVIGEQWYGGSTLQLAIGQASLTVTPLQIARLVAAIANDGYLVTPRFVSPATSEPGSPVSSGVSEVQLAAFYSEGSAPSAERIPGLSPGTLRRVREAMFLVVDSPDGTGRRAAVEGIAIAGKTGTAEVGGGKNDHAWFVGFVPADAPRYAFAVVLEHGGSGGATAAPLAKSFLEAMAEAGLLRRSATQ